MTPRTAALSGALVLALAAPAAAAPAPAGFVDSAFAFRLQAAAVAAELDRPQGPATPAAGYTAVSLAKEAGDEYASCEAAGGAVHDDSEPQDREFPTVVALSALTVAPESVRAQVEQPLRTAGWDVVGPRSLLDHPTEARDSRPNLSPGEWESRSLVRRVGHDARRDLAAQAADGPGARWAADCPDDTHGEATASYGDGGVAGAGGSTTSGIVAEPSGAYYGTARAFVANVVTATAGSIDAVASILTVHQARGRQPRLSYRLVVTDSSVTHTLASGTDVALRDLAAQFNRSVAENAPAIALLAPLGLTLMAPSVVTAEDGTRSVRAPLLSLALGSDPRRAVLGEAAAVRLVTVAFEGRNDSL